MALIKAVGLVFVIILPMVSYTVYAERRVSEELQGTRLVLGGRRHVVGRRLFRDGTRIPEPPKASTDAIIAYVEAEGLRVEWLLETHAHADHLSAAQAREGRGMLRRSLAKR